MGIPVGIARARASPGRARPRGFTLIELMVVLAIVGMLLSLLMPAYAAHLRARRRADAVARVNQVYGAILLFRQERGAFPWSPPHVHAPVDRNAVALELAPLHPRVNPGSAHAPVDRNAVALELAPLHPRVNPGSARACAYNTAGKEYLPGLPDAWLADHDGDGNVEIVDPWGWPLKFRVDPRSPDAAIVWSLGDPRGDARRRASAAELDADRAALSIGDETADCPDGERAENGYGVEGGVDLADPAACPRTYYCFRRGGTGNDVLAGDPADGEGGR